MSAPAAGSTPAKGGVFGQMPSLVAGLRQSRGPAIAMLEVDKVEPDPNQPRKVFDEEALQSLAESIKEIGLLQPITVRSGTTLGTYIVVAGEPRWRAHRIAGLNHIPAIVRSSDDCGDATLIENLQREDLTLSEQIALVARLIEERGSATAAARAVRKPAKWITERSRLAGAPEWVLSFVATGFTTDATALYDLVRFAEAEPERARRIVDEFEEGDSLRSLVREAIKASKPSPPAPQTISASRGGETSSEWSSEARTSESDRGEGSAGFYDGGSELGAREEPRFGGGESGASSDATSHEPAFRRDTTSARHESDRNEEANGSESEEPSIVPVAAKSIEADADASCLLIRTKNAVFRVALSKRLKVEMQKALAQL